MQKNLSKYFWDGAENYSGEFRLRRILEYASFPDLISYPFEELKQYLPKIDIERLRTAEKRKQFLKRIAPLLEQAQSWDDVLDRLLTTATTREGSDD